jgi:tetratricopeptide (TPR) repeat protein
MQNEENPRAFVRNKLPWILVAGTLALFLITLNHWVSLRSLPVVSKVTGWDWTLPVHSPLLFLLTYPFSWLPESVQPFALNLFTAVCAALTLGLLARSVAILPHDRTHEQRVREHSEFSFLSIPLAWVPPVLAVLVCGLQLTFWEHATALTGEMLDLLVFAYVIRCLLEFRISADESWLTKMAIVYGLGVTNNWALIAYFPFFLGALIWIKGIRFFEGRFLIKMFCLGLAGLLLYLLLPILWQVKGNTDATFYDILHANWTNQKAYLTARVLRNRALLLSLPCVLPVILMGFRWPSSFGETNAVGATLTNIAFRAIHLCFLAAWLWVVFDPKYSPRGLGLLGLSFLTFYYLGALSVGYYAGYALLVFTELPRRGGWHKPSPLLKLLNPLVRGAVLLAVIAIPIGLFYKNYSTIQAGNGKILSDFATRLAGTLPSEKAYLLSDDPYLLSLIQAKVASTPRQSDYVFVNTRALEIPNYHFELRKHYGTRWPDIGSKEEAGSLVDQGTIQEIVSNLAASNRVVYLHPSFGYFFETVYLEPFGESYQLHRFEPDEILPPKLTGAQMASNQKFWSETQSFIDHLQDLRQQDSIDANYLLNYYSRAVNTWGVLMQRNEDFTDAAQAFKEARAYNTNNLSADLNLRYSEARKTHTPFTDLDEIKERFRSWNSLLAEGGPVDEPTVCNMIGEVFLSQSQFRQAALYLSRAAYFQPTNFFARFSLTKAFIAGRRIDKARAEIKSIRQQFPDLSLTNQCLVITLEAACDFNQNKGEEAEQKLLAAHAKYPNQPIITLSLVQYYLSRNELPKSLGLVDELVAADSNNASLKLKKAELLLMMKESEKAHNMINQAIALKPKGVRTILYGAFVDIREKRYDEALKLLDRVLELDPDNVQALVYKANIFIEQKQNEKSFEALDKALDIQPANIAALRNRAILNLKLANYSRAKKDYETLQRVLPRSHVVYYGLGDIAYQRKDYEEAAKYFQSYLKYAPSTGSKELLEEREKVEKRLAEIRAAKT